MSDKSSGHLRIDQFAQYQMSQTKKGTSNFRWSSSQSEFAIKFLAQMVHEGFKVDKAFKQTAYTRCADAVNAKWDVSIEWKNVYSHYKSIKTWWEIIDKARNLSGNGISFDDTTYTIIMDHDTAREYIAAHPKADRWINKPIMLFKEMQLICGNDRANGEFFTTSSMPFEGTQEIPVRDASETIGDSISGDPSDAPEPLSSSSAKGKSSSRTRKRRFDDEVESALVENLQLLTSTFDTFNETIKTSIQTPRPLPPHLDGKEVASTVFAMASHGFSDDELYEVCSHLIREEKEANIFMCGMESVRLRWIRDFLRERHGRYIPRPTSSSGHGVYIPRPPPPTRPSSLNPIPQSPNEFEIIND